MTDKEKVIQERLLTSIQKCHTHLHRIRYASVRVENLFPLTIDRFRTLTDDHIGHIDQLIFRFTKLQYELGNNTFRYLLEYFQEDISNKPFRDILNILERFQIIDSPDTWISLRELGNDLAHEYPVMVEETVAKINYLIQKWPELENILSKVEQQIRQ